MLTNKIFNASALDVPDISVALVDDERHTFYHYHRSIESQCHGVFLAGMVYINQVGSVFGDALIGLDIGDNLIIII